MEYAVTIFFVNGKRKKQRKHEECGFINAIILQAWLEPDIYIYIYM